MSPDLQLMPGTRPSTRKQLDLRGRQMAVFADFQVVDFERTNSGPNQLEHLAPKGLDHAADLAVASLVNGDFHKRIFLRIANPFHDSRSGEAISQLNSVAKRFQLILGQTRRTLDEVSLGKFAFGTHDPIGELRVVRQDQKAGRILVQTPHRASERIHVRDQVINSWPTLGVFVGSDVTLWLVEQKIDLLLRTHRLAIERDFVPLQVDPVIRSLDQFAVDAYTPSTNPLTRLGARSQACFRDRALQSLQRSFGY